MSSPDSAKSQWWRNPVVRRALRAIAAAVPVTLVNATAFIGQFAFLHAHIHEFVPVQVMVAIAIESIGVYLAWHAYLATMANDNATRLKMGAYSIALAVGAMNYSHYAVHWRPTFEGVLFAMMSAISPALWGVHTKRASRDELLKRGLIEERGLRVGFNRSAWHPLRAIRLLSWSAWHGVNEPEVALAHFSPRYGTKDEPCQVRSPRHGVPGRAVRAVAQDAPAIVPAEQAVPALRAVPAAPPEPAAPVTGSAPVVDGTAPLSASPRITGTRPPQEVIDEVEAYLMGLPDDYLPSVSVREVARRLGDPNQRRLGGDLLARRKSISGGLAPVPPGEEPAVQVAARQSARPAPSSLIAQPAGWGPGGAPHDS